MRICKSCKTAYVFLKVIVGGIFVQKCRKCENFNITEPWCI
jgi:hypothetical protein